MDTTLKKAYAELYDIIYHMEVDLFEKIPDSFLDMLEENMDKSYEVNIDYEIGINNQELLSETRALLALVYRNFICDEEEKEKFDIDQSEKKIEENNTNGVANSLEERFNMLGKSEKENVVQNAIAIKPKHESLFRKILNFFKIK